MTQPRRDLWPEDLGSTIKEIAPVTILKEQASLLGQRTKNIVKAEVGSSVNPQDYVIDVFYLVAPALNNYKFALFEIRHSIEQLYPVTIASGTLNINVKIATEDELLDKLEQVLSHEKTIRIIESMLAQSGAGPSQAPFKQVTRQLN